MFHDKRWLVFEWVLGALEGNNENGNIKAEWYSLRRKFVFIEPSICVTKSKAAK